MTQTIPYVRDLRITAATVVAQHISAGGRSHSPAVPYALVEAALDAAAWFLVDAHLIEEAVASAEKRAACDLYRYLVEQQRKGELRLRTLEIDQDDAPQAVGR